MKRMRFFAGNPFKKGVLFLGIKLPSHLLCITIMLFIVIGGFASSQKVFAQTPPAEGSICDYSNAGSQDGKIQGGNCISNGTYGLVEGSTCTVKVTNDGKAQNGVCVLDCSKMTDSRARGDCLQNAANQASGATAPTPPPNTSKCSLGIFSTFDFGACIDAGFAWIITHTLLAIAGWFLWITATVMNYAISIGILRFSEWAPSTLYPIWTIIRQIVSLFVVFAGLWLGFMYIINKKTDFEKYIPWVVIFALFVNFSYPLARTVIDISNIVSLNIYASAVGSEPLAASTAGASSDKTAGTIIMNRLGLVGLVDFATGDTKATEGSLNKINSTPSALLAVIFVGYAAYIFFVAAALIITRTAVLVFLIVASPLLFVDKVIPKLGEGAEKLRGIFWEMLFVGPVFTIMLALTLKFLEVFQGPGGPLAGKTVVGASTGDGAIAMFFNILMMLIMLHIMLKVTKSVSGTIGQAVAGVAGGAAKFAMGGVAGLGARAGFAGIASAGRGSVGRLAGMAQGSKWASADNIAGRTLFRASGALANNSFDLRNTSVVQKNAGRLGMTSGMGTGGKLGYDATIDAKSKDRSMRANFVNNYAKKKENRMREEFNTIDEKNIPERKKWLSNMRQNGSEDQKAFAGKLEDEEMRKAMVVYKNIDQSTASGLREASEFKDKHKGDDELSKKISESMGEHDKKIDDIKTEKAEQKNYQKETLQTNKEMVAELKAQSNARLGGANYQKGMGTEAGLSEASKRAIQQNTVKAPDKDAPFYTTNPGGVIAIPNSHAAELAAQARARDSIAKGTIPTYSAQNGVGGSGVKEAIIRNEVATNADMAMAVSKMKLESSEEATARINGGSMTSTVSQGGGADVSTSGGRGSRQDFSNGSDIVGKIDLSKLTPKSSSTNSTPKVESPHLKDTAEVY